MNSNENWRERERGEGKRIEHNPKKKASVDRFNS